MRKKFYAHSLPEKPEEKWQLLETHLTNVGNLAQKFAESFKAGEWAYYAGLWHDVGKYSEEFQNKIVEQAVYHIDHATAGAQEAVKVLPGKYKGKLLAYAISGHHSGLLDGKSNDACLAKRLAKDVPDYSACPREIFTADTRRLLFPVISSKRQEAAALQSAYFIRMIYSCLVDADSLDTEAFVDPIQTGYRKGYPSIDEVQERLRRFLAQLAQKVDKTNVNIRRQEILSQCLEKARYPQGIFSLTVPTGGGKTLSSLAFALEHAAYHNLKRVIYVIPYTSIIEQNADVFRAAVGTDAVVEHHSNFNPKTEDKEELTRMDLACENWDAPLIVTTSVQFFESLFANKRSRCRKVHNIAESVVIIDEAQMLPIELLKPCIEALRALAAYKTTIVLCSATQPAVQRDDFRKWGLEDVKEIVTNPQELYRNFKRVNVEVLTPNSPSGELKSFSDEKIIERIKRLLRVLCVVNTRVHARQLYEKLKDPGTYHLSALMCPAHRSKKLEIIRKALKEEKECRLISTQLIEAGVDVDFPVVFRALAGVDSIVQTAGRCNREGLLNTGNVFMFMPECGLPRNGYLRMRAQITQEVIRHHKDILSLEAIDEYFTRLYGINEDGLDKKQILTKLSEGLVQGDFPFETVAKDFEFIGKAGSTPVIIPWDETARDLLRSLRFASLTAGVSRRLQRFTVTVWPTELNELEKRGFLDKELQEKGYNVVSDAAMRFVYFDDIGLFTGRDIDPGELIG